MAESAMTSVAVVGAGPMGTLFAARMAECGCDVVLADIDDGRLDTIARQGIELTDDRGTRTVWVRPSRPDLIADDRELVLLFTKSMHTAAATASISHLAGSGASILTLQNGLFNPERIAEVFAPEAILKGVAVLPADFVGDNGVKTSGSGHIELGAVLAEEPALAATQVLREAGFDARFNGQIDEAIWEKVAFNAALNSIAAVTGARNGAMDNAPARRIASAIAEEVVATAHASSVSADLSRVLAEIDDALTGHPEHRASMLQDRLAGRPSEIEAINGAVVQYGQESGVPTPVTRTLADLVRLIERNSRS